MIKAINPQLGHGSKRRMIILITVVTVVVLGVVRDAQVLESLLNGSVELSDPCQHLINWLTLFVFSLYSGL
jgi:hypothetical protein